MTETTAAYLDSLPVASLPARYGIARSVLYNRLADLSIETEKRGNKAYVNAAQLELLDELHHHIQNGGNTAEFLASHGQSAVPSAGLSVVPSAEPLPTLEQPALVANLLQALATLQPAQPDPLANLELLEKACHHQWHLSTSQLAPLLGLKTLPGKEFCRYGFVFTRVGRNGAESAWRVKKQTETN